MNKNIINFSINKEYLSHWGVNEALREILQNFLDYGTYTVSEKHEGIELVNGFAPTNLEFLAIGMSNKDKGARGKHGEGLKMALLVLLRNNIHVTICTATKIITPIFTKNELGETFSIEIQNINPTSSITAYFAVFIKISKDIWEDFNTKVIKEEDIIFNDNYFGKIVNKPKGEIYCGGLYVCKVKNITKAYDINPPHLELNRDRALPSTFDINWATSKINSAYGKLDIEDLIYSDTTYIEKIPTEIKRKLKPTLVGNSIEVTYKEKGKTIVVTNSKIKELVLKDSFFSKIINRIRKYLANKLGIYDLLVNFRDKNIYDTEAIAEFNIILEKLKEE